jgi:hypothetical protein
MPITLPFQITPGTLADAIQVQADFQAIADRFNAGIVDADISPSAAINGNKISTSPGSRVPTASIEDIAITTAKVATGAISLATQIVDGTITSAKIAPPGILSSAAKLNTYTTPTLDTFLGVANLPGPPQAGSWKFASTGLVRSAIVPVSVTVRRLGGVLAGSDVVMVPGIYYTDNDTLVYLACWNVGNSATTGLVNYKLDFVYWSTT